MSEATNKTILVVDDEPDTVAFLETTLRYAGFTVVTAANGEEALDRVRERKPDLISLDLVMPRKSGIKFFYELRKNKAWASIPVMIVTGHARDEMGSGDLNTLLEQKMISGPQAYLEKPLTPERYVVAIQRALGLEETAAAPAPVDRGSLRKELEQFVDGADEEQLKRLRSLLGTR
jgi:CheY-like chemotaxis protein